MKLGCVVALMAGLAALKPAMGQVSVYADFSASKMTNLIGSTEAYGPTLGVSGRLGTAYRVHVSGDVRAFRYSGGNLALGKNNLTLTGLSVGPKLSVSVHKFEPYVELAVGFARYDDGDGNPASKTTDGQTELIAGTDYQVSKRFDWRVMEFSYKQYYALGGEFNPKTLSTGIVYHLGSR